MKQRQLEALDLLLDDHYALWDFAASIPSYRPDVRDSANGELLALLQVGYVTLTFGRWFENQTSVVADEQAVLALQDPKNWEPTGKSPGFVLELSDKGSQYLSSVGIKLPNG